MPLCSERVGSDVLVAPSPPEDVVSPSISPTGRRRTRCAAVTVGLMVVALAVAAPAGARPVGPAAVAANPTPTCAGDSAPSTTYACTVAYPFTGGEQTFVVPRGVTSVLIGVGGADGGQSSSIADSPLSAGGNGGQASRTVDVTPGRTLFVEVGGDAVEDDRCDPDAECLGGFNGGGTSRSGGGGGGATDVRTVTRTAAATLDSRLVVAGGGGGGGMAGPFDSDQFCGGLGGDGGDAGQAGGNGHRTGVPGGTGGGAGTAPAGGAGGVPSGQTGTLGTGAAGGSNPSGAGGGGFRGGGSGGDTGYDRNRCASGAGGGGGGASWAGPDGTTGPGGAAAAASVTISYRLTSTLVVSPVAATTGAGQAVVFTPYRLLSDGTLVDITAGSSATVTGGTCTNTRCSAAAAGRYQVRVTTSAGVATATLTVPTGATSTTRPAVTTLAPTVGPSVGGTSVTLTGTGLAGTTDVRFGDTPAFFRVVSDTRVVATSPAHAAGAVTVAATTSAGTSAPKVGNTFTYHSDARTWSDLTAFAASGADSVQLGATIGNPAGQGLRIGGTTFTLDLHGYALTIDAPGSGIAGVEVTDGRSFTVTDTVGGGALAVVGGAGAAGIGSTGGERAGSVTIEHGNVKATGGSSGAGVGGGAGGPGGPVTITGGAVAATAGSDAAAVGAGSGSTAGGGSLLVTGGSLVATSAGAMPAIGGTSGGPGAEVFIGSGTNVTASSAGPTAIGGASGGAFGRLTIAGGLTIPAGSTLVVPTGVTVDNSGRLRVSGSLTGTGTVHNSGLIVPATKTSVSGRGRGPAGTALLVDGNNYTLSFDRADLPGATPGPIQVWGATVAATGQKLPTPKTADSQTFQGWFTAATGGTLVTSTTELATAFGVAGPLARTLYAHTVT